MHSNWSQRVSLTIVSIFLVLVGSVGAFAQDRGGGNGGTPDGGGDRTPGAGESRPPDIEVTPTLLKFDDVAIGGRAEGHLTIRNLGEGDLVVSWFSIRGDSRSPFDLCGGTPTNFTLGRGAVREVPVCFTPQVAGTFEDAVVIVSNDPDEYRTEVALTGQTPGLQGEKAKHRIHIQAGDLQVRSSPDGKKWGGGRPEKKLDATQDTEIHIQFSKLGYREVVEDEHKKVKLPHKVKLTLDWGDGNTSDVKLKNNQYAVDGEKGDIETKHTWTKPGTYFVKLIAEEQEPHKGVKDEEFLAEVAVKPPKGKEKEKWFDAYVHPTSAVKWTQQAYQALRPTVIDGVEVTVGKLGTVRVVVSINVTITLSDNTTLSGSGTTTFEPGVEGERQVAVILTSNQVPANRHITRVEVTITPTSEDAQDANERNNHSVR